MKDKRFFVLLGVFLIVLFVLISSGKLNDIVTMNLCKEGLKYESLGKIELAEQKYKEAMRINPNYISAKTCLFLLYKSEFFKYLDASEYEKAIPIGEQALIYGDSNSIIFDMAICYSNLENFSKAAEYYKKILEINPNDEEAKNGIAYVNYKIALQNGEIQE